MSKGQQTIRAARGFDDVLPSQTWKWQAVEQIARDTARAFHFKEIRTPLIEFSELFHRGVGESTDIIQKETFDIAPRKDDSDRLSLRPEQTAGVVRAMIESGALNDEGARAKLFYIGPNFRYEKPQKGRVRQHYQFGIEAFGIAEPEQDVECMMLQVAFFRAAGLKDWMLRVNTLGDAESKQRYRDELVRFLEPKRAQLSEESQRRLEMNPLRVLDSKDERDIKAIQGAPSARDALSDTSRRHFERVVELLNQFQIAHKLDDTLVRGLDYYSGTIWEFVAGGLGAQNALGGGGRYDNLVEQLGGRATPGVGFGSGLERLLIALEAQGAQLPQPPHQLVWLVAHGDAAREHNLKLLNELRTAGIAADMDLGTRSVKSQFKLAEREQATISLVVGDDELKNKTVQMKELASRAQTAVERDWVVETIKRRQPQI